MPNGIFSFDFDCDVVLGPESQDVTVSMPAFGGSSGVPKCCAYLRIRLCDAPSSTSYACDAIHTFVAVR